MVVTTASGPQRTGELSKKEVHALLADARMPQDHLRLDGHCEAKAKQYEAESAEHAEMAKMYGAQPSASDTAAHCQALSATLVQAAKDARALASSEKQIAK